MLSRVRQKITQNKDVYPPIVNLVERRTVEKKQKSLGPWLESGSVKLILYIYFRFFKFVVISGIPKLICFGSEVFSLPC